MVRHCLRVKPELMVALSAEAFDKDVKPVVMALSNVVNELPIDAKEKKYFSNFVLDNLRIYSDNYANAYASYFQQLQVRIDSVWALNYFDQIQHLILLYCRP